MTDSLLVACAGDLFSGETTTFIVGAGASISSGGPLTSHVEDALGRAVRGRRLDGEELGHALSQLLPQQRLRAVEPLFTDMRPGPGYLALAALARSRKVRVVNLNWDLAIEKAAELLGVQYVSLDHEADESALLDALETSALVIWHVHGSLERDVLHGTWNTAHLGDLQTRLFLEHFIAEPTLAIGTSIADIDLRKAFGVGGYVESPKSPTWVALRSPPAAEVEGDIDRILHFRQSQRNRIIGDYVDFDSMLVNLLALEHSPDLEYGIWTGFVLPESTAVRDRLLAPLTIYAGEPFLGKTTLAERLAELYRLVDPQRTERVVFAQGADDSLAALRAEAGPLRQSLFILDDAFASRGDTSLPASTEVTQALYSEIVDAVDSGARLLATSRLTPLAKLGPLPNDFDETEIVSGTVGEWYGKPNLLRFVDHAGAELVPNRLASVRQRIATGEVATPAGVLHALELLIAPGIDSSDVLGYVMASPARDYLTGVRLSELAPGFYSADVVAQHAEPRSDSLAESMVTTFEVGDTTCVRLAHPSYREAVDQLLLRDDSPTRRRALDSPRPWTIAGLRIFDAMHTAAGGSDGGERLDDLEPTEAAAVHARLLSLRPVDPRFGDIDIGELDDWTILPIVYEIVAGWPAWGRNPEARSFLHEVLQAPHIMGTYAVAEALMYLGRAAPAEVVDLLAVRVSDLIADRSRSRELSLIIDAFLYQGPGNDRLEPFGLAHDLVSSLEADNPQVIGAVSAALNLHYDPARFEPQHATELRERSGHLDPQQCEDFAWMIQWHFVHQAQNRSLLDQHRITNWVLLQPADRSRIVPSEAWAASLRGALRSMGQNPSTAGWAVHYAMNVRLMHGAFGEDRLVAQILRELAPGDEATVAAALTYPVIGDYRNHLQRFMSQTPSQETLAKLCDQGITIGNWSVAEPFFHFTLYPNAWSDD